MNYVPSFSPITALGGLEAPFSLLGTSPLWRPYIKSSTWHHNFDLLATFLDPKKWCRSCVDPSTKEAKRPILCSRPKMGGVYHGISPLRHMWWTDRPYREEGPKIIASRGFGIRQQQVISLVGQRRTSPSTYYSQILLAIELEQLKGWCYKGQKLPMKIRYRCSKLQYRCRKLQYRYRLLKLIPVSTKLQYWYRKVLYIYNSPERMPVRKKLWNRYQKLRYQYRVNIFNGK